MRSHFLNAMLLLTCQGISLACLLANQAIIKRSAGVETLGYYSFLVSLFIWLAIIFEMGWGATVARAAALSVSDSDARFVVGALLWHLRPPLIMQLIGAVIAVWIVSVVVTSKLLYPGLVAALFGMGFSLQITVQELLLGRRDTRGLAFLYGAPQAIACMCLTILASYGQVSIGSALWAYTGGLTLVCVLLLLRSGALAPHPTAARVKLARARADYGQRMWLGNLMAGCAFAADMPLLGVFTQPASLAHYAIAKSICNPLGVAIGMFIQPIFKDLANVVQLPRRWLVFAWGGSLAGGTALALVGPFIARCLLGMQDPELRRLLVLQSIASTLTGLYVIYNRFLGAQGHGDVLYRGGFFFGSISLVGNLSLIPLVGALGACIVNVTANAFWLAFCISHANRLKRQV